MASEPPQKMSETSKTQVTANVMPAPSEDRTMKGSNNLRKGIVGTVIAAVCCFTPFLVVALGAVGLSSWLGWLDYVLFPMLFASMGLVAHALYRRAGEVGLQPKGFILAAVVTLSALIFWLEFRFALRISIGSAAVVTAYAYYLHSAAAKHVNDSSSGRDGN